MEISNTLYVAQSDLSMTPIMSLLWKLDLTKSFSSLNIPWERVTPVIPFVTATPFIAHGSDPNSFVLFGPDITSNSSQLFRFNVISQSWANLTQSTPFPYLESGSTVEYSQQLISFGGFAYGWGHGGSLVDNSDLYSLDLGNYTWNPITVATVPPNLGARDDHTATLLSNGNMVIIGGRLYDSNLQTSTILYPMNTLAVFNLKSNSWSIVSTTGPIPRNRHGHSAVLAPDQKTIVVFGGSDNGTYLNDLWLLDTTTMSWNQNQAPNLMSPQIYPEAMVVGDQMIIDFGYKAGTPLSYANGGIFSLSTFTWITQFVPILPPNMNNTINQNSTPTDTPTPSPIPFANIGGVGGLVGIILAPILFLLLLGIVLRYSYRYNNRRAASTDRSSVVKVDNRQETQFAGELPAYS